MLYFLYITYLYSMGNISAARLSWLGLPVWYFPVKCEISTSSSFIPSSKLHIQFVFTELWSDPDRSLELGSRLHCGRNINLIGFLNLNWLCYAKRITGVEELLSLSAEPACTDSCLWATVFIQMQSFPSSTWHLQVWYLQTYLLVIAGPVGPDCIAALH